jgi:hypothetical protein
MSQGAHQWKSRLKVVRRHEAAGFSAWRSRTLEDYYRAGTITGALIDLSNSVGVDAVQAKLAKDTFVVGYGFAVDTTATSMRAFIHPNGKFDQANYKKIAALLQHDVTDPLSRILSMPQFASVQADLMKKARSAGYIK